MTVLNEIIGTIVVFMHEHLSSDLKVCQFKIGPNVSIVVGCLGMNNI